MHGKHLLPSIGNACLTTSGTYPQSDCFFSDSGTSHGNSWTVGLDDQMSNVQRIVDLVTGARVDPDVNGLDQVIASGLVPDCAMGVKRAFDGGDLSLYAPTESCACYFEAKAPQSTTKCSTCASGTCAIGVCRRGYCEVR